MRVLVIGSNHGLDGADSEPLFAAAHQVGCELARRGHTILVGSDSTNTIDYHIVLGAVEDSGAVACVEVHRPDDGYHPFQDVLAGPDGAPELPANAEGSPGPADNNRAARIKLDRRIHPTQDWYIAHMHAVAEADAILLMGGARGGTRAGSMAHLWGKAVVPVGTFGGASETMWRFASGKRREFYGDALDDIEIDRLKSPWKADGGKSAKLVVDVLEKSQRSLRLRQTGSGLIVGVGAMMFIMFVGLILLFCQAGSATGSYSLFVLFGAAACAGVAGASIRTLHDLRLGNPKTGRDIVFQLVLGLGAAVVSSMLFLVAEGAVSGEIGQFAAAGGQVRVVLIVSLVSLFSGLYLDAAFARFESVKKGILRGEVERPPPS